MRDITRIVIHHAEAPGGDREFIKHVHVDKNGWRDIGYHAIICNGQSHGSWRAGEDGEIQEGRPEGMQGAHARGYNLKMLIPTIKTSIQIWLSLKKCSFF